MKKMLIAILVVSASGGLYFISSGMAIEEGLACSHISCDSPGSTGCGCENKDQDCRRIECENIDDEPVIGLALERAQKHLCGQTDSDCCAPEKIMEIETSCCPE